MKRQKVEKLGRPLKGEAPRKCQFGIRMSETLRDELDLLCAERSRKLKTRVWTRSDAIGELIQNAIDRPQPPRKIYQTNSHNRALGEAIAYAAGEIEALTRKSWRDDRWTYNEIFTLAVWLLVDLAPKGDDEVPASLSRLVSDFETWDPDSGDAPPETVREGLKHVPHFGPTWLKRGSVAAGILVPLLHKMRTGEQPSREAREMRLDRGGYPDINVTAPLWGKDLRIREQTRTVTSHLPAFATKPSRARSKASRDARAEIEALRSNATFMKRIQDKDATAQAQLTRLQALARTGKP